MLLITDHWGSTANANFVKDFVTVGSGERKPVMQKKSLGWLEERANKSIPHGRAWDRPTTECSATYKGRKAQVDRWLAFASQSREKECAA